MSTSCCMRCSQASTALRVLAPTPATVPFYEALGFSLVRDLPDRVFDLPPPDRLGAPRRRR